MAKVEEPPIKLSEKAKADSEHRKEDAEAKTSSDDEGSMPDEFLDGNVDLVAKILAFAAQNDSDRMADLAEVSRVFAAARQSPATASTPRTGAIHFKHTRLNHVPVEKWQEWNRSVFQGSRTRLVVVFYHQLDRGVFLREHPMILENVTEIIAKAAANNSIGEYGGSGNVRWFFNICPNVKSLDISCLAKTVHPQMWLLNSSSTYEVGPSGHWPLEKFRCTAKEILEHESSLHFSLMQPPNEFGSSQYEHNLYTKKRLLREIHLDPFSCYFALGDPPIDFYCKPLDVNLSQGHPWLHGRSWTQWFRFRVRNQKDQDRWLLQEFPLLERVTLKNAKCIRYHDQSGNQSSWEPLPQEALIKFVRHTPNLQWFCSDLTKGNIAMLKKEFPHVEFCN